jgi:hypothetical protein
MYFCSLTSIKSRFQMWQTDIQDWTKITKDMVNFYLNQAEAELKSTLDLHDKITTRAFALLTILIPITTLTIGYIIRQIAEKNADKYLLAVAVVCLYATISCLYLLIRLVFPRQWLSSGRPPKDIFTSQMIDTPHEYTDEQRYVGIVMREIENIQYKITFNDATSIPRLYSLRVVIITLSTTFFLIALLLVRQLCFFIA